MFELVHTCHLKITSLIIWRVVMQKCYRLKSLFILRRCFSRRHKPSHDDFSVDQFCINLCQDVNGGIDYNAVHSWSYKKTYTSPSKNIKWLHPCLFCLFGSFKKAAKKTLLIIAILDKIQDNFASKNLINEISSMTTLLWTARRAEAF